MTCSIVQVLKEYLDKKCFWNIKIENFKIEVSILLRSLPKRKFYVN